MKTYTDRENKFSISYPDSFENLPLDSPEIVFLIRSKEYLFPTFNILVLPGPYDLSQADSKHADSVLDSYKLVGINDALPIRWFRFRLGDQNAFSMELKYKNNGEELTSAVTIATASDRHYILTYIDRTANWDSNKDARARIIGSFTVLERSKTSDIPKATQKEGIGVLWIALFLGVPLALYMFRKQRR